MIQYTYEYNNSTFKFNESYSTTGYPYKYSIFYYPPSTTNSDDLSNIISNGTFWSSSISIPAEYFYIKTSIQDLEKFLKIIFRDKIEITRYENEFAISLKVNNSIYKLSGEIEDNFYLKLPKLPHFFSEPLYILKSIIKDRYGYEIRHYSIEYHPNKYTSNLKPEASIYKANLVKVIKLIFSEQFKKMLGLEVEDGG